MSGNGYRIPNNPAARTAAAAKKTPNSAIHVQTDTMRVMVSLQNFGVVSSADAGQAPQTINT
ncbi:MAG: hypothetical protein ACREJC_09395 [Tepidisphaeraceae bacterium]